MKPKHNYQELEKRLDEHIVAIAAIKQKLHNAETNSTDPFSNTVLESLFDLSPASVSILRQDFIITYANKSCKTLHGDPSGKFCYQYFRKRKTPCTNCPVLNVFETGISQSFEFHDSSSKQTTLASGNLIKREGDVPIYLEIGVDISERKSNEAQLRAAKDEINLQLKKRSVELLRKNIALTEVLSQLEIEKANLDTKVSVNVRKMLMPIVEKLIEKSSSLDSRYLMMLKQNLEHLTSSIGIKLSSNEYNLTPKEIELCTLIKNGFSIKEISTMQNLSERTVETHRFNIRKKLGMTSSKINLSSYLAQL